MIGLHRHNCVSAEDLRSAGLAVGDSRAAIHVAAPLGRAGRVHAVRGSNPWQGENGGRVDAAPGVGTASDCHRGKSRWLATPARGWQLLARRDAAALAFAPTNRPMADESQRVHQHPALQALESLQANLDQAFSRAADDPGALAQTARLRAMREYAAATLAGVEPMLVTDQVLNQIQANVQNIASQLANYSSGNGTAYLANAMNEGDNLFAALARVPSPIGGQRAAAITRAMGAYHQTVDQYTRRIQEQQTTLENRLSQFTNTVTGLEQRVTTTETRVDSVIAQYQSTFEVSQAQRQQAFDAAQAQRQQTFDTEVATQRADFNEVAQQLRTASTTVVDSAKSQLAEAMKALDEAIGHTKATARKAAEDVSTEYRGIADALNAHLETRRDEADKLVGLMGERAVTSTYQKTADEARSEMIWWQLITVVVMVGLLAGAIFEFLPALKDGWNWGVGGARVMVAIIATLLAGYTGTQAKIARDTMRTNRRREMDLAALGPYLAPLPEEDQHEMRTRIADRYFVEDGAAAPATAGETLLTDPDVVLAAKGIPKTALLAAIKAIGK